MSEQHTEATPNFTAHFFLFLLGGLCLGAGLLTLYWSFGWPGGPLNSNFALVGFNGLDNITALDPSDYSIPLVVVGLSCLIFGNSIAWRYTGGY